MSACFSNILTNVMKKKSLLLNSGECGVMF